jgi:hypothetical protein
MLYLSICITLLVMIAAMHLLAKAKKENLGSLFTWVTYIIIVVTTLVLICQVARGCKRMCSPKEKEMHHMMMGRMGCEEEMEGCSGMGNQHQNMKCEEWIGDCKGMKKGCSDDDDDADSTSHKGMH